MSMDVNLEGTYRDLTGFSFERDFSKFLPGRWEEIGEPKRYSNSCGHWEMTRFIQNTRTGDRYLNEPNSVVRIKLLFLSIETLFLQTPFLLINMLYRTFRVITFTDFWASHYKKISPKERFKAWLFNILRIILTPIFLIGLELSAIYGIFDPKNGKKNYSFFEKWAYGESLIPCLSDKNQDEVKILSGGIFSVIDVFLHSFCHRIDNEKFFEVLNTIIKTNGIGIIPKVLREHKWTMRDFVFMLKKFDISLEEFLQRKSEEELIIKIIGKFDADNRNGANTICFPYCFS